MKTKLLFITFIMIATSFQLTAQTVTWDGGAGTTTWSDAMNWDTNAVPTTTNDVVINSTVILTASTQVQRVLVSGSSADLTIDMGVTLTIDGFAGGDDGLEISSSDGNVTNNGIIAISNIDVGNTDADGLYNKGTFINNGTITIDGSGQHGMYLQGGTFTNNLGKSITIMNYGQGDSGADGLYVDDNGGTAATFNNNGALTITMSGSDDGIYIKDGSEINNAGLITVGGSGGDNGIRIDVGGAFNNNTGGTLTINSTPDDQLFLDNDGAFNNTGILNLNNASDVGLYVTDQGVFTNNADGMVNISSSSNFAIQIDANNSTANIANSGTITTTGGKDGLRIQESGTFTNNTTGTLDINSPNEDAINFQSSGGTMNNSGMIDIDNAPKEGLDMSAGTFNNMNGGTFKAIDCTEDNIEINGTSIFNNDGTVQASRSGADGSGRDDIEINSGATFVNTANAMLLPGTSAGEMEIRGDFNLGSATCVFEIGGTTHTTEFDRIDNIEAFTMTVTANTKMHLDWGSYVPTIGDKFKVIDGNSLSTLTGTFNLANVSTSNAGIIIQLNYTATEVEVEVVSVLSTNDFEANQFSVYPNPAKDVLNIKSNNLEITSVSIFNILGKQVINTKNVANGINVSSLKTGIYLVKINSNDNSVTKKIIID